MNTPDHPDRHRRKLYGRRKGPKLSARQAGLRQTLLGERPTPPVPTPSQFPNSVREIWLEVGFGAGEHLVGRQLSIPSRTDRRRALSDGDGQVIDQV